jgi:hypothetical protein
MIHHNQHDDERAREQALAALHTCACRLADEARVQSGLGDLAAANLLHAGAMALAAMHRRAIRGDDDETRDLERRAALAALENWRIAR